jgi:hypothetical protein
MKPLGDFKFLARDQEPVRIDHLKSVALDVESFNHQMSAAFPPHMKVNFVFCICQRGCYDTPEGSDAKHGYSHAITSLIIG